MARNEQLGMFDEKPVQPAPVTPTTESDVKAKQAVFNPPTPNPLVTAVMPTVAPTAVTPTSSIPQTDIRQRKLTARDIPPVQDTPHDDTGFVNSLIDRAISVSQVIGVLHTQDWLAVNGGNIRLAYFSKLEEYRGIIALLWPRRPNVVTSTLESCQKEVVEVERKLDLLIPVYESQNKPEAVGQVIDQLALRQHLLHDQLSVLEPIAKARGS